MKTLQQYILEKLIINKDYKNVDVDFYDEFKEDIDSLFKDKFFEQYQDIESCMYPKTKWKESLRSDIINIFNKNGNSKNACYKGIAWNASSNPINKEACKVWTKFIKYIKENKDNLDLLMCKERFHCIYIINTNKAIICLDGNTDIYNSEFSSAYIIIQYKQLNYEITG